MALSKVLGSVRFGGVVDAIVLGFKAPPPGS